MRQPGGTGRRRWVGRGSIAAAVLALAVIGASGVRAQQDAVDADNVITRLARRMANGEATLEYRTPGGYLPSLLEHLDVNQDSQVVVFSKTSFQHARITPQNPRALYFNDDVSVGMVPGGEVFEIMALDPGAGLAFYSIDTARVETPTFKRRGVECQFCHGPGNHGAPAMVVTTVIPTPDGTPAYTSTFFSNVDHRVPFAERWGGWYVTGTHGSQRHRGNAVASDPSRPLDLDTEGTQNRLTLEDKFDTSPYLARSSDLVALMTLEHQSGMTNLINSLTVRYRQAERAGYMGEEVWAELDKAVDEFVTYMVFADEVLLEEPIAGTSTFSETFPERGPTDSRGRSLREFDLRTRLFRYPLSYMVYNRNFDEMPPRIRERVYRRLFDVLTGVETGGPYGTLSPDRRQAALEILRETKPTLPEYWHAEPGR